jgi:YD repeat-containing protein
VLLAAPALAGGTLELNPSQGAAGDEFQVSGDGFEAFENVKLKWDGKGFGPPIRTDADGAFTTTRNPPVDAPPGKYTVTGIGLQSGLRAEAMFTVVDPAVTTTTSPTTTTTFPTTTTTSPTTTTAEGKTITTAEGKTTTTTVGKTTATTDAEGKTSATTDAEGKTSATTDAEGKTSATTDAEGKTIATTDAEGKTTATTDADEAGWLVAADDTSAGTGFEFLEKSDLGDLLTTPIGLASVLGVPLFGAFLLWWMWRRPSDDEEESSEFGD